MKKSILTLAVLAAVCPADADTIKTIVWNTTTDPVLTNLTFDYTGAQLKAGSNGKSYFDVVDVIGATGRKDDVGLVVNANGSVNSSGDTQVIVLDISGDAATSAAPPLTLLSTRTWSALATTWRRHF